MAAPTAVRRRWLPSVSLVLGVGCVAYYALVFRPLVHRADLLDRPLMQAWERFASTNRASPEGLGTDVRAAEERLRQLQGAATNLQTTARLVRGRLELSQETRDRMAQEPFQLIDFENERFQRGAQLSAAAKERQVVLEPPATAGLPEYVADMPGPALLWPRLSLAHHLLLSAIQCKVSAVRSLSQLGATSVRPPGQAGALHELAMRLELVGPMDAVARFLVGLPLTGAEWKAAGLPEGATNKPPLFIGQLLLRKGAPERPHEVQLDLTVSGFVLAAPAREKKNSLTR